MSSDAETLQQPRIPCPILPGMGQGQAGWDREGWGEGGWGGVWGVTDWGGYIISLKPS